MEQAATMAKTKAAMVREVLEQQPRAKPRAIVAALKDKGVTLTEKYVTDVKYKMKHSKRKGRAKCGKRGPPSVKYPRHSLEESLRIPAAILDQNAGRECSLEECARFVGVKATSGEFRLELSSATKFGLLDRQTPGRIKLGDIARKILRPHEANQQTQGLREAVLKAPQIADVYSHYRGENLPDDEFFSNALVDNFHIPADKVDEFKKTFLATLKKAHLLEDRDGKFRVLDFTRGEESQGASEERLKKLGKDVQISSGDTCFVMMPFASPHGNYYSLIYEPAIKKAGLKPIRADNEIFGTGKIIDQVWKGINSAKVLVAELTTKNPNVFYELGLAHALRKPVVLVSANEPDVPFDLQHIRVIYYDVTDPFWGEKLQAKIAENIISAIKNPEEAIFKSDSTQDT
jgi:hypothetical protein